MIPRSPTACQTEKVTLLETHGSWQQALSAATLSAGELLEQLGLDAEQRRKFLRDQQIAPNFPLRATADYLSRIRRGDPDDPLLLQVLPRQDELVAAPGYSDDPLDELNSNPAPGIVHKYHGRALLLVTQACAIHCRYCFRRNFPYTDNTGGQNLASALAYLRDNTDIHEIIFSGGDPLSASDRYLARICDQLAELGHIRRLRIHSRMPVVLPARIDNHLLRWLEDWPGQSVMVIHSNHPRELDAGVGEALARLSGHGVTLLNQSVLLAGINDSRDTLVELSERLFELGVMPYYLHQLDPVTGTQHFAVSRQRARELISNVSAHLPGFLVPKLVEELPGESAKRLL